MALGLDSMDEEQVRTAAKLLERENERLLREVLELKQKLSAVQGGSIEQMQLLADLEHKLAVRDKALFGRSSEKRGAKQAEAKTEKPAQTGHGPREQMQLAVVEREHDLDIADKACKVCGEPLTEMRGQYEESDEVDVLERQFVLLRHKRKKYRQCGGCVETALGPDKLMAGGRYSIDFAVSVAVAKYADHAPLERQVRVMKRQGLVVDWQTLWDQLNALVKWLAPAHERLHQYVLAQPVIGAGER